MPPTTRSSACCAARLGFAAMLLCTASMALAGPAKRPKARRRPSLVSAGVASPASAAAAQAPSQPPAPQSELVAPAPAPLAPVPTVTIDPVVTSNANATPNSDREADVGRTALGQQEAARIAAGRVEVAVLGSLDIGSRHFTYSDPVGRLLAPYHLNVVPMTSFGLEAYPLASTSLPFLRDLGFRGRYSRAFAVDSNTPDGATINTSWRRFGGEVRERLLVPGAHPLELGVYVGGEASYFDLSTKSKVAAFPPRARTISVRLGLDARILVAWRFSALLSAAYLATTERGEIYDRFRNPKVNGVDSELGCALRLLPGLEARLTGRYTRYFATFEPKLGDLAVAGGALDQQAQFGLGARYAH